MRLTGNFIARSGNFGCDQGNLENPALRRGCCATKLGDDRNRSPAVASSENKRGRALAAKAASTALPQVISPDRPPERPEGVLMRSVALTFCLGSVYLAQEIEIGESARRDLLWRALYFARGPNGGCGGRASSCKLVLTQIQGIRRCGGSMLMVLF